MANVIKYKGSLYERIDAKTREEQEKMKREVEQNIKQAISDIEAIIDYAKDALKQANMANEEIKKGKIDDSVDIYTDKLAKYALQAYQKTFNTFEYARGSANAAKKIR